MHKPLKGKGQKTPALANFKIRHETLLEIKQFCLDHGDIKQWEAAELLLRSFKGKPEVAAETLAVVVPDSLTPVNDREARMVAGLLNLLRDKNALPGWTGTIETLLTEWMPSAQPTKVEKKKSA